MNFEQGKLAQNITVSQNLGPSNLSRTWPATAEGTSFSYALAHRTGSTPSSAGDLLLLLFLLRIWWLGGYQLDWSPFVQGQQQQHISSDGASLPTNTQLTSRGAVLYPVALLLAPVAELSPPWPYIVRTVPTKVPCLATPAHAITDA